MSRTLKDCLESMGDDIGVICQKWGDFDMDPLAVFAANSVLFVDFPCVSVAFVGSAPTKTGRLKSVAVVVNGLYAENVTVDIQKLYEPVPGVAFSAQVKRSPSAMHRLRRIGHT